MITLAKHIELLLLDNDCVVVPDFGGFIAHYQSAYYNEETDTFFPPQRIIGFNPKLTMNDGLLVQAYMDDLQTDFSDANHHIEKEVDELKEQLYCDGSVNLINIGVISCNIDGNLTFIPSQRKLDTPSLYGLSSFHFSQYATIQKSNSKVKSITFQNKSNNAPTKHNNSVGYGFIGSAIGIAVALILFFFLSVPVENSYVDNGNYAYLGDAGLFSSIKSKSFASTIIELPINGKTAEKQVCKKNPSSHKMKEDTITSQTGKEVKEKLEITPRTSNPAKVRTDIVISKNTETKNESSEDLTVSDKTLQIQKKKAGSSIKYHIIVSSVPSLKDAQRAVEIYHNDGYANASVIEGNGRFRISLCSFEEQSDAYNKIRKLNANGTFMDAWVLRSK